MCVSTKSGLINPTLFQHNNTASSKQTSMPTSKITSVQTDRHTQTRCSRPRITYLPLFLEKKYLLNGGTHPARLYVGDYTVYTPSNMQHSWSIILDTTSCRTLMMDAQGYTNTHTHKERERERERERETYAVLGLHLVLSLGSVGKHRRQSFPRQTSG